MKEKLKFYCLLSLSTIIKNNQNSQFLDLACNYKNKTVIKLLLKYGVDVNTKDEYGRTALYMACKSKDIIMTEFLLKAGADVNVNVTNAPCLFHLACSYKTKM